MIIVIDGLNRHKFGELLDEMYRLRARVFEGRLGWDVKVKDGKEIDEFDSLDPAHVVCLDEDGDVVGCMRLLQTTGPHMLADVFYELLDGEPPLRSSRIWEATRFCVDTRKLTGTKKRNSISYVTSEVMVGAFEYAQEAGVLDAVAVIDPVMNRVMKRSRNAPYDYIGSPKPMGVVTAMAALMDCSDERIEGIREFAGIRHDVFLSDEDALKLFYKNRTPAMASKSMAELFPDMDGEDITADKQKYAEALKQYCYEQVMNATTPKEVDAAMALMEALRDRFEAAAGEAEEEEETTIDLPATASSGKPDGMQRAMTSFD
ncbi:acyl-homoserine-lactone synthase [Pseudodonghicola flavimaris]|uniref:Acyl-homoserine-lactone synthase n=1 Tax=Pseudodonghicola flavimaris TaxID=3050036 RepID=A0ABT7F3U6_9RHOB|nr:acyl-homoserine-lactone synthase [Pseudodonghicola flavimaris]MDK3019260.1 acyl-homoserine-lactone synthase [Pseudodonghicola flavimaris]